MHGKVSQNFDLGPSFFSMICRIAKNDKKKKRRKK